MSELVTREDRGRVSILTLQNPPANGYSYAMHRALDAHVLDLRMDRGTDVIVLRGAGERFFCAGADIGYLSGLDPEEKYSFCLHANETLLRLENTPKLVIAALNGHCVGGGLEIALACDLRVGRASVGKPNLVGLPEVSLGVLPGTGGTQRLTRVLGRARALQWMVEGRNVSVEEAAEIGLVHQVLPADGWWDAVLAYAASFTRPGRAAGAVGLIKRAVHGGADLSLEAGLALERELQMRLFSAPDAKEGLAAFLEKRTAVFKGDVLGAGGAHAPPATPPPAPAGRPAAVGPAPSASAPAASPRSDLSRPEPTRAEPLRPEPPRSARDVTARSTARDITALTASDRAREPDAFDGRGHLDRPGALDEGWRGDAGAEGVWEQPPRREIPPEFVGFEDFADFGPDEMDPGDAAFGTGGRPHTEHDPLPGRIDLHRTRIPDAVLNLLGRSIVERYMLLPVKRTESTVLVAMADPGDAEALDAVREETGLEVQAVRAPELDIAVMIARYYRA